MCTLHSGLIAFILSLITSVLGYPTVFVVATNCLLQLVISTTSKSHKITFPRPDLTSVSTLKPPTAPKPNYITVA